VLESVVEQQRQLKLLEKDLRDAHGSSRLGRTADTEKYMRRVISRMAELDGEWHELSEWWKLEYFKRQWAAGFCYHCQGDGKTMESTGDPKHPLRAVQCTKCLGKGRVPYRKPRGGMIPAGWPGSPEAKKAPPKRR
jgi:hypothetical protein